MMTKDYKHISTFKDGSIVHFPHSCVEWMKVCDKNGCGGVVDLLRGEYISVHDLPQSYGVMAAQSAPNLDALYFGDEEDE